MWLVIGYGSTLHGDDRFGPLVAERIALATHRLEVDVISGVQLTPDYAEPISRACGVVFVDASATLPPGELRRIPLRPGDPPPDDSAAFTHHCSPQALLSCASTLYGAVPRAWIVMVGGATFDLGAPLSAQVESAIPRAAALIMELLPPAPVAI